MPRINIHEISRKRDFFLPSKSEKMLFSDLITGDAAFSMKNFKKEVLELIELIGMFAGILTTCAFFPQVIKTIKSRSTDDLSWEWLVMMIGGVFLWLVYGYYINSISLLVSNIITFVSVNLLFGVKYSNYRKKKHS